MLLYYLRHFLKPEIYGPGYWGAIKQGFYETPWVTVATIGSPVPLILIPYGWYRYDKLDAQGKRYVAQYTIFRPNDERLAFFSSYIDRTKASKKP